MMFVSTLAEAKINPDSVLTTTFKPRMEKYLKKVTELTDKISAATVPDSIRHYAKKIMRLSDKMEEEVNDFYRYRGSKTDLVPVFLFTSKIPTIAYALVTTPGDPLPLATKKINRIYESASHIRFLWSKNPGKIKKNLSTIHELKEELWTGY